MKNASSLFIYTNFNSQLKQNLGNFPYLCEMPLFASCIGIFSIFIRFCRRRSVACRCVCIFNLLPHFTSHEPRRKQKKARKTNFTVIVKNEKRKTSPFSLSGFSRAYLRQLFGLSKLFMERRKISVVSCCSLEQSRIVKK